MQTPTVDTVFVFLVVLLDLCVKRRKKVRRFLNIIVTYSCLSTLCNEIVNSKLKNSKIKKKFLKGRLPER